VASTLRGAFELKTAYELLQKLRHDLEAFRRKPTSTYRAFNFFVTAEHMKDWTYPGDSNRGARERLQAASPLLQVCSHLANGAKHFIVERPHHQSVAGTGRAGGWWPAGYWARGYWARGYWGGGALVVDLQGDAARALCSTISALDLAERILAFWERCPEVSKP
jgi:hypothetical protein